jgi:hypothetical protein
MAPPANRVSTIRQGAMGVYFDSELVSTSASGVTTCACRAAGCWSGCGWVGAGEALALTPVSPAATANAAAGNAILNQLGIRISCLRGHPERVPTVRSRGPIG